ncbi:MAG: hypothetical protein ACTSU0_09865 [Alphaproteobacteria bacterium]
MLRFALSVLAVIGFAATAQAADVPYVSAGYHGHANLHQGLHYLPACDTPAVLARISERFAYADARIQHTGLAVEHIDGTHQHQLRAGGPGLIDRRYCGAQAWLSDGQRSEVVYVIEADQGFASLSWSVESCLPAFDKHRVYGAWCRSIRH